MESYTEITLADGTVVRCEAVPFLADTEIIAAMPECRMPSPPVEVVNSKHGPTTATARPGTPEYNAWEVEADRVRAERARVERQAPFFLGVHSWKLSEEKKFSEDVPKDWEFPRRLVALGVPPRAGEDGRRWDYIVYGLLRRAQDSSKVQRVLYGMEEITPEEGQAVADKFPGDEEQPADN